MANPLPVVRQSLPVATFVLYAVWLALLLAAEYFGGPAAFLATMAVSFGYWIIAREVLTAPHRRGMRLFQQRKFAEAITAFEQSYADLVRRPWIDRYRTIVLLSPSRLTYREMALCNQAFCWAQLGDKAKAKAIYEQTLREYPGNTLAESALRFLA